MFFYLYFLEKNIKLQTDITLSPLKIFVDSSIERSKSGIIVSYLTISFSFNGCPFDLINLFTSINLPCISF